MKRTIVIAIAVLAVSATTLAQAGERKLTVLFAGGPEANEIRISLSEDGRSYVVDSIAVLEVGGDVCSHPEENPYQLVCRRSAVAGFEVNGGGGDDAVILSKEIPVSATLRGGPGDDRLIGGAEADKIVGGAGNDLLVGRLGADRLYGGRGRDRLLGNAGPDVLRGGPGRDALFGGAGRDRVTQRRPQR